MSSEPAVHMPGAPEGATVIETGSAPKAPVAVPPAAPVAGRTESQARAMAWVNETAKPALLREGGDSNLLLLRNYNAALAHAFHGGPLPDFLKAAENGDAPAAPDMREHDSLRDTFEAAAQPATETQRTAAVSLAVLQGVNPNLAREVSGLCGELALSEAHTAAVLDRVRSHAGASHFQKAADGIEVLEGRDFEIFAMEAARTIGGLEKLKGLRDKAAEYIKSKGLSERLEAEGFWQSTLSLDPRFLLTLANAALSRGGK